MSDISQIKVKGVTYDVKDAHSRSLLETYEPIIQDYEENGARTDGYYETMGVGVASNVKGSVDEDTDFLYRKTGGDKADNIRSGNATITSLKGNTILFNQKIEHSVSLFRTISIDTPISYNKSQNLYYATVSSASTSTDVVLTSSTLISNHVYLFDYNSSNALFNVHAFDKDGDSIRIKKSTATGVTYIFTGNDFGKVQFYRKYDAKNRNYTFGFALFDLTEIFGEGNEPMDIDYFKEMFPSGFPNTYYNLQQIVNADIDTIETIGFNQVKDGQIDRLIKGEKYQITGPYTSLKEGNETIVPDTSGFFTAQTNDVLVISGAGASTCVHFDDPLRNGTFESFWNKITLIGTSRIKGKLNGIGDSVIVFPNGMAGMNGVQDTIIGNVATKKFNQINNLPSLPITLNYEGYAPEEGGGDTVYSFILELPKNAKAFTASVMNGLFNKKYSAAYGIRASSYNNFYIYNLQGKSYVEIMDNDFSKDARFADEEEWDALIADIQESLSDKVLLYELSNYEQYVFDSFSLPINYKVDSKGIESIHVYSNNGNSLPCQMTINYLLDIQKTVKHSVSYLPTSGVTEEQKQNARKNIGLENFVASINGQTGIVTQLANVINLHYYDVVKDRNTGEFNSYYSVNLESYEDDYVSIYNKILHDKNRVGIILEYADEEQDEDNTFQNLRINAPFYSGESIGFDIIFNDGTKDVTIHFYYPDVDPGGGSGS